MALTFKKVPGSKDMAREVATITDNSPPEPRGSTQGELDKSMKQSSSTDAQLEKSLNASSAGRGVQG